MNNVFEKRLKRLMDGLEDGEAALITSEINVHYFSGFPSSEGTILAASDYAVLIVDFRYIESAQSRVKHCEVLLAQRRLETIAELLKRHGIKKVCLENDSVSLRAYEGYRTSMPDIEFDTTSRLFEKIKALRIIKDEYEIERLRTAQKISEKSYIELLNYLKPGVSESSLALELEYLMRKNGAERAAFDLITIAGENTSKPHGVPGDNLVSSGDLVTFDIGAVYDGYHSDMTRTVAVTYVTDEQREIYDIVLRAQRTALSSVRSEVSAKAVDGIARDIISEAGYADNFGHATGHGVGLEIHEYPVLSPNSTEILKPGMIVTVEPGIYIPQKFGVRIEDTVCVTENGAENLVNIGKDLIIL